MQQFRTLRRLATIALTATTLGSVVISHAQVWPERPVTIILPYAVGGPTDSAFRVVARAMSEDLNQSVVIENKPGGSATIGAQYVARAHPDGYTLLAAVVANMVTKPLVIRNVGYDPLESFSPISLVSSNPLILVASKESGLKTFQDVLKSAREKPGKLACASFGAGTPSHWAIELLNFSAKLDLIHVPYNGSASAMTDVLSGRVPLMMDILPSQLQNMQNGRVYGIAIGQKSRSPFVPDVPTFEEVGVAGFLASTWMGLSAPKGTPESIITRLSQAVRHAIADPEVQKFMSAQGYEARATSPEEFDAIIREDYAKWAKVIEDAHIKLD